MAQANEIYYGTCHIIFNLNDAEHVIIAEAINVDSKNLNMCTKDVKRNAINCKLSWRFKQYQNYYSVITSLSDQLISSNANTIMIYNPLVGVKSFTALHKIITGPYKDRVFNYTINLDLNHINKQLDGLRALNGFVTIEIIRSDNTRSIFVCN